MHRFEDKISLLFVCSRNKWRSPTAENVWRRDPRYNVRSAGTSPKAKRTIGPKDLEWADIIFVMEKKHKSVLQKRFFNLLDDKELHVLDIPDDYQFMDEQLICELEARVEQLLPG